LKIALDATYSLGVNLSGVGVYSREILLGLGAAHPEAEFSFCYRPHRFLRSFQVSLPRNCRRRLLWESWMFGAPDLFHGLNQRMPRKARFRRAISTFHDLFVLTGDYSTSEFRRRFAQQAREAAVRSDLIIAVSEFTAGQVANLLGVERARLRVVPHGVRRPAETSPPLASREKLILHVGAVQRRKNIERLVEAFEQVGGEWRLALAGSPGFGAREILGRIEDSPRRKDIEVLGYASDEVLKSLYRRAAILAFPSLDEGFGMPVLEAMAAGVPVLTSNRSALPEVSGDAALLVDATDVSSITDGLRRLTADENLQEELAQRGLSRVSSFSWEAAVGNTWAVYQELLSR
jgi:glycosyltransferase involved in cell wall biosynthesis